MMRTLIVWTSPGSSRTRAVSAFSLSVTEHGPVRAELVQLRLEAQREQHRLRLRAPELRREAQAKHSDHDVHFYQRCFNGAHS